MPHARHSIQKTQTVPSTPHKQVWNLGLIGCHETRTLVVRVVVELAQKGDSQRLMKESKAPRPRKMESTRKAN